MDIYKSTVNNSNNSDSKSLEVLQTVINQLNSIADFAKILSIKFEVEYEPHGDSTYDNILAIIPYQHKIDIDTYIRWINDSCIGIMKHNVQGPIPTELWNEFCKRFTLMHRIYHSYERDGRFDITGLDDITFSSIDINQELDKYKLPFYVFDVYSGEDLEKFEGYKIKPLDRVKKYPLPPFIMQFQKQ